MLLQLKSAAEDVRKTSNTGQIAGDLMNLLLLAKKFASFRVESGYYGFPDERSVSLIQNVSVQNLRVICAKVSKRTIQLQNICLFCI